MIVLGNIRLLILHEKKIIFNETNAEQALLLQAGRRPRSATPNGVAKLVSRKDTQCESATPGRAQSKVCFSRKGKV